MGEEKEEVEGKRHNAAIAHPIPFLTSLCTESSHMAQLTAREVGTCRLSRNNPVSDCCLGVLLPQRRGVGEHSGDSSIASSPFPTAA